MTLTIGTLHAEPSTSLRVWKTYPDAFDLTLTSVFRPNGVTLQAAFNHRRGKTFFAYQGDRIGPYTLHSISSSSKHGAIAVLRDTRTSEAFKLTINTPTPLPDLRAQLADLSTAQLWDVRKLDELTTHGIRITSISSSNATASSVSGSIEIPPISEAERNILRAIWQQARTQLLAAIAAAKKARADQAERILLQEVALQRARVQAAQKVQFEIKSQPRFFYGTEYRVPSSYAYYYTFKPTSGGVTPIPQIIAIPTGFETRTTGWSLNVTPQ